MSNNGDFDTEDTCTSGSSDDEDFPKAKIRKTEATVTEEQTEKKPEEEDMKADLIKVLNSIIKVSKIHFRSMSGPEYFRLSFDKGILLHGKSDLGSRVERYLQLHGKAYASVFSRDLVGLSLSECDDLFKRATCCNPSLVLLAGVEHATGDMSELISRNIKEIAGYRSQLIVVGTTAMPAGVAEKLKESFTPIIDLKELTVQ